MVYMKKIMLIFILFLHIDYSYGTVYGRDWNWIVDQSSTQYLGGGVFQITTTTKQDGLKAQPARLWFHLDRDGVMRYREEPSRVISMLPITIDFLSVTVSGQPSTYPIPTPIRFSSVGQEFTVDIGKWKGGREVIIKFKVSSQLTAPYSGWMMRDGDTTQLNFDGQGGLDRVPPTFIRYDTPNGRYVNSFSDGPSISLNPGNLELNKPGEEKTTILQWYPGSEPWSDWPYPRSTITMKIGGDGCKMIEMDNNGWRLLSEIPAELTLVSMEKEKKQISLRFRRVAHRFPEDWIDSENDWATTYCNIHFTGEYQ